ncbi:MAG: SocA family protein [Prevotellaceae bacterium]|jgi:uncharacterized phage-associated protein|nr:SocA family protein [Prevotellaceae bacterium]
MTTPIFEPKKGVEAFLYVAGWLDSKDIHRIFKVLYFADREHLAKYGRPITSDTYVKYPYSPVPSNIYAMVNSVKGGQECSNVGACGKAFSYAHTFTASGVR